MYFCRFKIIIDMKKVLILIFLTVLTVFQAQAVLKEKDLPQTLGVLRAELAQAYSEQKAIMANFERRNMEQHSRLVSMMQNSNQIALMFYSQNADFTLDMAYACQAATEQYRQLRLYHAPYDKMKERINLEIERYNALIKTLENLPPRILPNGVRPVLTTPPHCVTTTSRCWKTWNSIRNITRR